MPAPLQFVRMTTSIGTMGVRACSVHPIIAHDRVPGSETADAFGANG
jgi:hypothetical protein